MIARQGRIRLAGALCLLVLLLPVNLQAGEDLGGDGAAGNSAKAGEADCRTAIALLEEQSAKLSRELRQIKREIAVLNQNLEKPGIEDAMAGVGYIFGFLGIAAFFLARRRGGSGRGE